MSLNSNTINNFATTIKKGGMCSKIDMITCLVSTLVYAYLVRLINTPITTKKPPLDGGRMVAEPPLDGGRMTVEMYRRSYKIVSLHTHQSDCRCSKIVYAYADKVAVGLIK